MDFCDWLLLTPYERPQNSSLIVVTSPLRSLMNAQTIYNVEYLQNIGISAISISDDENPNIVQQVMDGTFNVAYGSPKWLSSAKPLQECS